MLVLLPECLKSIIKSISRKKIGFQFVKQSIKSIKQWCCEHLVSVAKATNLTMWEHATFFSGQSDSGYDTGTYG